LCGTVENFLLTASASLDPCITETGFRHRIEQTRCSVNLLKGGDCRTEHVDHMGTFQLPCTPQNLAAPLLWSSRPIDTLPTFPRGGQARGR
jgi:hypothetical protein